MKLGDVMGWAGSDVPPLARGTGAGTAVDAADSAARDLEIAALAYDSRGVGPGTLFFCVPGVDRDGHDYAADAVARGAVALVVERALDVDVPQVLAESARAAMGPAAARFYGAPSRRLAVIGVTGTNGKTTTAFLVRELLEADGQPCALMGTVKAVIGGRERDVVRTTPEAIDVQAALAEMLEAGDRCCAMEVSSHALALGRADAIHFAAAVFTNLTQDHLDFHTSMEDYFQAKRALFVAGDAPDGPGASIVNLDDSYGRRLAEELGSATTFAIDRDADYRARDVVSDVHGSRFVVQTPDGDLEVRSPLPGRFNVHNVLGAVAAARALGVSPTIIQEALPGAGRVPGRFEPVDEGQSFAVLVDYAHTPDGLDNVLRAARELSAGRLICVFGAGGDRDRSKRPRMGAIAAALADVVIVTSDNPRSEDPEQIIREIVSGIPGGAGEGGQVSAQTLTDRRTAIQRAIELAGDGDVVLIAGKGHEQGQEFEAGRRVPFDDVTIAREALRAGAPA
jgi:UDP-N-acetylmuramoyl-L-alanyl-D-glutamate--2,6-diaminopimelate ligase